MPQLITPLDDIFAAASRVRLLRLLISDHHVVSARAAARLVGMSPPAILQAAEELVGLGLALREEGGHQIRLRANEDHVLFQLLRNLFAAEDLWPVTLFNSIREELVPVEVVAACVFGSMARGEDQPGSDFDLLVLVEAADDAMMVRDRLAEHAPSWRARFGINVSPVVIAVDRARTSYAAGNSLLIEAARDARMIIGAVPLAEILAGATSGAGARVRKLEA